MGDKTEQPTEIWRPPGGGYLEGEDAEGHKLRRGPEGAADEPGPEEVKRRMVAEDDEDDTEGHRSRR